MVEGMLKATHAKAKLTRAYYLNLRKEGFGWFEALLITVFGGNA